MSKVLCEVSCWRFLALCLGRPVEVESNQVEIENNQYHTMREIAVILQIPKSIKLLVKMKNVSFIFMEKTKQTSWLPNLHFLLPNVVMRVSLCGDNLILL